MRPSAASDVFVQKCDGQGMLIYWGCHCTRWWSVKVGPWILADSPAIAEASKQVSTWDECTNFASFDDVNDIFSQELPLPAAIPQKASRSPVVISTCVDKTSHDQFDLHLRRFKLSLHRFRFPSFLKFMRFDLDCGCSFVTRATLSVTVHPSDGSDGSTATSNVQKGSKGAKGWQSNSIQCTSPKNSKYLAELDLVRLTVGPMLPKQPTLYKQSVSNHCHRESKHCRSELQRLQDSAGFANLWIPDWLVLSNWTGVTGDHNES